jgi:hypothetical protein
MGKPNVINMDKESDSELSQSSEEQVEQKYKKEAVVKKRTHSIDKNSSGKRLDEAPQVEL